MSVEELNNAAATAADLTGNAAAGDVTVNDDDALGAIWDQVERDNGAARANDGKFANADGGDDANADAADTSLEGETGEAGKAGGSTLSGDAVPLPANWNGMDADWAKIPPDVQAKIAARDSEIHARMSESGRQISAFKPVSEVLDRHKDLLAGKTMPDGSAVTMPAAVDFLMNAQRRLETNPIAGLIEIADRFGVRQHLAAALNGRIQIPSDPQPAGLKPADVERIVKGALNESAESKAAAEELSRLSKDKPLYAEIAEDDMVHSIHKARARLGDAASKEAVFDLAYDMAVNADPDLRVKAAAAKKAAAGDPKRTADAKRANAVNVTSNATGQTRQLTEDEQLAQAYDLATSKG
ncbi:hypothetical protein FJ955_03035 [Mesorhizobium sp. B2-2-2]|uniref:hypothetical protein n=1 Tax=Mesorhizobium sp. B2-2-2 TaxID=2589964 RepID=UPI001129CB15|nr:hypothetical protein [Mesorhizobium sp. B2-2-2]TPM33730.1 hypothetical protein FJ955_03035 [Mesorhizobium sp. B2-2-2]